MIPGVESVLDSRVNIFLTSDESDAFQDNCFKNYHVLGIPFTSTYSFKLHCEDRYELFTNSTRRNIVELGWKTNKFFPPILPLTILFDSTFQKISRILVHPILVDTKDCDVECIEVDIGVV